MHSCSVHLSLSEKRIPKNTRFKQHCFLVDPRGVSNVFRIFKIPVSASSSSSSSSEFCLTPKRWHKLRETEPTWGAHSSIWAPANSKVLIPIQKVAHQRAHTEFWRRPEGSQKASHFVLGILFLVCAAIITWVSASKIFLPKKDSKTLRYHAVSRWISFAIKVIRKPTGYRSHHWLRGLPLPSSTGHPCLGLWESKSEHVLVGFGPIEQRDVAHQNLAWERNLPYPIYDCRHLLAAASCHFSRCRLALICTKPRVQIKQQ